MIGRYQAGLVGSVAPRPHKAVNFASVAVMDSGIPLRDGRLIQIPDLPLLAYLSTLLGPRKVIPAELHPDYGTYTLVSSMSSEEVYYKVALASFVADTSAHDVNVNGTVYGDGTTIGATEEAVLSILSGLINTGESITTSVTGTGAAARLVFPVQQEVTAGTNTTTAIIYPTDWAETLAETGSVRYDATNGLELHATDGATAVVASSFAEVAFTGLGTPAAANDRTVVVARHAWASDASLAASNGNSADMSLRLSVANSTRLYCASTPNSGSAGNIIIAALSGAQTGNGIAGGVRTEVWEVLRFPKAPGYFVECERLAGTLLGTVASALHLANVESANITWRAGNSNAASVADVNLYLWDAHVFQQGT